ncbi:4(,)5-DOPA dioxygenase extradiol [Elusimicrobium posterum]|uniref:4,5-DOPA-extradiol-dioxygenase n=1 Tax=Elusimicrobium posterum TaxID=3116653 RepID=UPI003C745E40
MTKNKTKMPVLFIGHGTPMNAVEDNEFSREWKRLSSRIPRPRAVVCISAHWLDNKTTVSAAGHAQTIYDFYGFPDELYRVHYAPPADAALSQKISALLKDFNAGIDSKRGLDHGAWCFLKHTYPKADIPVIEISIDYGKDMSYHFELAKRLLPLREEGVLIAGSGNMVHNLRLARSGEDGFNTEMYYDWAQRCNDILKDKITSGKFEDLLEYNTLSEEMQLAVPVADHYIPLLYALALKDKGDKVSLFNDKIVGGSLSMTSLFIGEAL